MLSSWHERWQTARALAEDVARSQRGAAAVVCGGEGHRTWPWGYRTGPRTDRNIAPTIRKGIREISGSQALNLTGRTRRPGAGRPRRDATDPLLLRDLESLLEAS